MTGLHKICPFFNLFFWTLYLMVLVGYRRIKHYLIMLGVMLVLFGLYAKCVGIKTVYRGRGQQSKVQSPTAAILPATTEVIEHCGSIKTGDNAHVAIGNDITQINSTKKKGKLKNE